MQLPNKIVSAEYNPQTRVFDIMIKERDAAGFYCVPVARAAIAFSSAEARGRIDYPIWADCEKPTYTGE